MAGIVTRSDGPVQQFETNFFCQGLSVVPLLLKTKVPYADRANDNHRFVFTSRAELERWPGIRGRCNWGLLGVAQIDPDSPVALEWLKSMSVTSGGARVLRSSRGYKLAYRPPLDCPRSSPDPTHERADLLGPRSMLVIPPSIHESGFRYVWVKGHGPADIPFNELSEPPATLMDYWRSIAVPPRPPRAHGRAPASLVLIYDAVVARLEADGLRLCPARGGGLQGDCPLHHSTGRMAFTIHPERGWHCFAGCSDRESGRLTALAVKLGVTI